MVHETLRLRPPMMGIGRITRQPITLGEHDFPANALIYCLLRSIHRNEDLYQEPDAFIPENKGGTSGRFLAPPPGT